jgi:predicted NUDIX family phosphoesterase
MERELNEELIIDAPFEIALRGILYDNARDVSKQHLAVVFEVDLSEPTYEVGERGFLQHDEFETWSEIGQRLDEFENWSQMIYSIYAPPAQG